MKVKPAKKPLNIWPVWAIFLIILVIGLVSNGNPEAVANWFWIALLLSVLIYSFNVKKFGKKYWEKSK